MMLYFQLAIEILLLCGTLYLVFTKSYLTEKGKNIATKQDIENITKKIESVRNEVQYEHAQRSGWNEKSKISLTNFLDEYLQLTDYSLRNISLINNHKSNPDLFRKLIDDIRLQVAKSDKSYWHLVLMESDDPVFLMNIDIIYQETGKLHSLIYKFLHKMEEMAMQFQSELAQPTGKLPDLERKRESLLEEFKPQLQELNREVVKGTKALIKLIREKLREKYNKD